MVRLGRKELCRIKVSLGLLYVDRLTMDLSPKESLQRLRESSRDRGVRSAGASGDDVSFFPPSLLIKFDFLV